MKHSMNHSMNHSMSSNESILVMTISMILAGTLFGMNIFVNEITDIRFNINDFYMSIVMTGFMFIFMSLYYHQTKLFLYGCLLSIIGFIFARNQLFVNKNLFIQSMIPHHSMAVMMSKKYISNHQNISTTFYQLLQNIIQTQKEEIILLKHL